MAAARLAGNRRREQNPAYGLLRPIFPGESVTQQEGWLAAVSAASEEYRQLPPHLSIRVGELVAEIYLLKESFQRIAAKVDADGACARCGGLCCRHGKHHFSAVDLLAYLATGRELFTPDFAHQICPYLSFRGCLMEPGLRPFNCIIFLCDQLEGQLCEEARGELLTLEQELRRLYLCLELLLGNRFANGLLITWERAVSSGKGLFNY